MVRDRSLVASSGGEMESISLEDLDEIDLLLTELDISQGRGNLVLCIVASPAYRKKVIEAVKTRFPCRVKAVEKGDELISELRSVKPNAEEILIWTLPETLSTDILDALNNFRELFYDTGVPSLVFLTPAELDDVIWKAPDFWRYRGGYHILKGEDYGQAYQAAEALSMPMSFSYQNKEELLSRKRINECLLEKIKNKHDNVRILIELATICSLLSEQHKAIEYNRQALAIAREVGDKNGEENALGNLGNSYQFLGDTRKAIEHYEQALAIAREIGDFRNGGIWLGNLGSAYAWTGEIARAIEYFEQALSIARSIDNRRAESANLGNLGLAYINLGDARKAIEFLDQALAIAREIGDRKSEGDRLGDLGIAYAYLGNTRKAVDYYEQQLRITQEIGDRRSEGTSQWNLSQALDQLGERVQAIECARASLRIREEIEDPRTEKTRRKLQEWGALPQKQ
ncbi:MAG: photosystem I assembly protein Ycf3 [Methanosaeta sp. PtaU1.Bin112]|nr:MAG: photosystem I assembly protein Ycf3 [Methanosaeta sp. PtaU1.Bin112]